jgi:hypothetical protein
MGNLPSVIADSTPRMLYHFTAQHSLQAILQSQEISVSAAPVAGLVRSRKVAGIVWLTDAYDPGSGTDHGLGDPILGDMGVGKRGVRFTVSVPEAQHWPQWAARHRVSRITRRLLHDAGGGLSERWWVVQRPIPAQEWVGVERVRTGTLLWS